MKTVISSDVDISGRGWLISENPRDFTPEEVEKGLHRRLSRKMAVANESNPISNSGKPCGDSFIPEEDECHVGGGESNYQVKVAGVGDVDAAKLNRLWARQYEKSHKEDQGPFWPSESSREQFYYQTVHDKAGKLVAGATLTYYSPKDVEVLAIGSHAPSAGASIVKKLQHRMDTIRALASTSQARQFFRRMGFVPDSERGYGKNQHNMVWRRRVANAGELDIGIFANPNKTDVLLNIAENGYYGVDLDGTLAVQHPIDWDTVGPSGAPIGEPIAPMVEFVKQMLRDGEDVRIFTARVAPAEDGRDMLQVRQAIEEWCKKHIGQVLPVTCIKDHKLIALYDDRAVRVEKNTGKLL